MINATYLFLPTFVCVVIFSLTCYIVYFQISRSFSFRNLQTWLRSQITQNPFGVSSCITQGRRLSWPLAGKRQSRKFHKYVFFYAIMPLLCFFMHFVIQLHSYLLCFQEKIRICVRTVNEGKLPPTLYLCPRSSRPATKSSLCHKSVNKRSPG